MFNLLSMLSQSICRSWFAAVVLTPLSWAVDTGPAWWHDIFHFVLILSFFFLCVAWDRTETAPSPRALSDFPSRRALEHVVHSEAQGLLSLNLSQVFMFPLWLRLLFHSLMCLCSGQSFVSVFAVPSLLTVLSFCLTYLMPVCDRLPFACFRPCYWFTFLICLIDFLNKALYCTSPPC